MAAVAVVTAFAGLSRITKLEHTVKMVTTAPIVVDSVIHTTTPSLSTKSRVHWTADAGWCNTITVDFLNKTVACK